MSNRHRQSHSTRQAPNAADRAASNRKARHNTTDMLRAVVTGEQDPDNLVDERVAHTAYRVPEDQLPPPKSPHRYKRHWKQRFWKRRSELRLRRARIENQLG